MTYAFAQSATATITTSAEALFAYLDDQASLGSHMEKPSMMMMGGTMHYILDAAAGRAVGSVIRMEGRFLWIGLTVEEVVTERDPPRRKSWQTRGVPRLIIMGGYRMGFQIAPQNDAQLLSVAIDYDWPASGIGRMLAALLARTYARWCVGRMARDAARHFRQDA